MTPRPPPPPRSFDALTRFTPRYDGVRASPADLYESRGRRRTDAVAFTRLFATDEMPELPDGPGAAADDAVPAPAPPPRIPFRRLVRVLCAVCGAQLRRTPRRDGQVAVCAAPCRGEWAARAAHATNAAGGSPRHPAPRTRNLITRPCVTCGAPIRRYASQFVGRFVACSRACGFQFRRARALERRPCITCGRVITRRRSAFTSPVATCSPACWSRYANSRHGTRTP